MRGKRPYRELGESSPWRPDIQIPPSLEPFTEDVGTGRKLGGRKSSVRGGSNGVKNAVDAQCGLQDPGVLAVAGGKLQSERQSARDRHGNGDSGCSQRGPWRVHSWIARRGQA